MAHATLGRGTVAALAMLAMGGTAQGQVQGQGSMERPWLLTSASQFRLAAPPDADTTRGELAQLRGMAELRDDAARARIAWWNAAAPAYRWNQIAIEESLREGANINNTSRRLALLHAALADAMAAAWDSKAAHGRGRPTALDPMLTAAVPVPADPSYPDEHAVAAAVASAVLAEVFPARAARFSALAEEAGRMRLLAGIAFPSDVAAGTALGRQVAGVALDRARRDGSDRPWDGAVPQGPGMWTGTNPGMPQAATWTPWVMASPAEFRPAPPPAHDSAERAAEMATLRAFARTPLSNARAVFWEAAVGGLRNYEYWNNHAMRLLMEHGQAGDARAAARTLAILNIAIHDAGVACWDAKYTYWTIRPSQLDPSFQPLFSTPNHPSYPSAHGCFSGAATATLAGLFPRDAEALGALAADAGASRIWAGIHYPGDVTAAQRIGEQVATRALERGR